MRAFNVVLGALGAWGYAAAAAASAYHEHNGWAAVFVVASLLCVWFAMTSKG